MFIRLVFVSFILPFHEVWLREGMDDRPINKSGGYSGEILRNRGDGLSGETRIF